jgi:hypothetical protein
VCGSGSEGAYMWAHELTFKSLVWLDLGDRPWTVVVRKGTFAL